MADTHIVVPIYNGDNVLDRAMEALARQVSERTSVALVLNGCVDRSEEVARRWVQTLADRGAKASVSVLSAASRTAALNAGDEGLARTTVYLDQDVVLAPGALSGLLAALDQGAHFASGVLGWRGGNRPVRAALSAWDASPYVRRSPVTAGLYAVSAEGRRRWRAFPDGLPDDKFARLNFAPHERRLAPGVHYSVQAPGSFEELVAARRRYLRSNRRLADIRPELMENDLRRYAGLAVYATKPKLWPGLLVFGAAELAAAL